MHHQLVHHMSAQQIVESMPNVNLDKRHKCTTCILAKHHREKAPKRIIKKTSCALKLIHNDLYGPINSGTSAKYILMFIDDFSRFTWTYFLDCKSDTFSTFKHFRAQVKKSYHYQSVAFVLTTEVSTCL